MTCASVHFKSYNPIISQCYAMSMCMTHSCNSMPPMSRFTVRPRQPASTVIGQILGFSPQDLHPHNASHQVLNPHYVPRIHVCQDAMIFLNVNSMKHFIKHLIYMNVKHHSMDLAYDQTSYFYETFHQTHYLHKCETPFNGFKHVIKLYIYMKHFIKHIIYINVKHHSMDLNMCQVSYSLLSQGNYKYTNYQLM